MSLNYGGRWPGRPALPLVGLPGVNPRVRLSKLGEEVKTPIERGNVGDIIPGGLFHHSNWAQTRHPYSSTVRDRRNVSGSRYKNPAHCLRSLEGWCGGRLIAKCKRKIQGGERARRCPGSSPALSFPLPP